MKTTSAENLTIFLDFDGVLHRKMIGNFELLSNFNQVLNLFPNIKIVISSDWRHSMKLQDYQEIFGEYANRIIGQTPIITGSTFLRELEILAYVRQHSIQKFIAIDDDCRNELFNANCNWLFKTDYFRGLDVDATNNLIKFIQIKLEEKIIHR